VFIPPPETVVTFIREELGKVKDSFTACLRDIKLSNRVQQKVQGGKEWTLEV
jgi:hypothetical protein